MHFLANATGTGWEDAFAKASALTAQLNLTEKIFVVTGVQGPCVGNIPAIPRVGFKGLCLQDGPLAIRQASYASVFPAGLSAAATWDRELIYQRGVALGQEFRGKGANVILGYVQIPCFVSYPRSHISNNHAAGRLQAHLEDQSKEEEIGKVSPRIRT